MSLFYSVIQKLTKIHNEKQDYTSTHVKSTGIIFSFIYPEYHIQNNWRCIIRKKTVCPCKKNYIILIHSYISPLVFMIPFWYLFDTNLIPARYQSDTIFVPKQKLFELRINRLFSCIYVISPFLKMVSFGLIWWNFLNFEKMWSIFVCGTFQQPRTKWNAALSAMTLIIIPCR